MKDLTPTDKDIKFLKDFAMKANLDKEIEKYILINASSLSIKLLSKNQKRNLRRKLKCL